MAFFSQKKKDTNDFGMPVPPMGDMNSMSPDMQQSPPNQYNQQYYGPGQDMNMPPQDPSQGMPMQQTQDYSQYPNQGYDQSQQSYPAQQQDYASQDSAKERIEEIAEAIIDEKWNELIKDINKVIEWKERTDGEIKKIQQQLEDLKDRFDNLHRGILGKITEYDQNLTNVGTEIKAMEMTFQKILPTFTENVNKLDRIIRGTGQAPPK